MKLRGFFTILFGAIAVGVVFVAFENRKPQSISETQITDTASSSVVDTTVPVVPNPNYVRRTSATYYKDSAVVTKSAVTSPVSKTPTKTSTQITNPKPASNTNTTQTPSTSPTETQASLPPPAKPEPYKDGTYSATGSYHSPAGLENVSVSVTIKSSIVVDSSVADGSNDNTSSRYQGMFIDNYKQYVTGKKIDSIFLTKVSGSSLTGAGFNDALAKIKSQAKS